MCADCNAFLGRRFVKSTATHTCPAKIGHVPSTSSFEAGFNDAYHMPIFSRLTYIAKPCAPTPRRPFNVNILPRGSLSLSLCPSFFIGLSNQTFYQETYQDIRRLFKNPKAGSGNSGLSRMSEFELDLCVVKSMRFLL